MKEPTIKKRILSRFIIAVNSLRRGLAITLRYLLHPKTVVTQQYPENRGDLKMFDRFRSQLIMQHDENGFHKCTACTFCQQACPNGSIKVVTREKPMLAKTELDALIWRLDTCTFCNACVTVCPFGVLKFEGNFENATFDRRLFVYNLSKYAGAPSSSLLKIEDKEERLRLIELRTPYYGAVPVCGVDLPGVPGLKPKVSDDSSENEGDAITDIDLDKPTNQDE